MSESLLLDYKDKDMKGTRLIPYDDVCSGLSVQTIGSRFAPNAYKIIYESIDLSKASNYSLRIENTNNFLICDKIISFEEKKVCDCQSCCVCEKEGSSYEYNELIANIGDKQLPLYISKLREESFSSKIISENLLKYNKTDKLIDEILTECESDCLCALKNAILDYVLKKSKTFEKCLKENYLLNEGKESKILFNKLKQFNREYNYSCHPIILEILSVWNEKYRNINIFDFDFSKTVSTDEFKTIITQNCRKMHFCLNNEWNLVCNRIIVNKYLNLLNIDSVQNQRLFNTIASLISRLLRQMIINNVEKWVQILKKQSQNSLPMLRICIKCKPSGRPYFLPLAKSWKEIFTFPLNQLLEYNKNIERIENNLILRKNKDFYTKYLISVEENDFEVIGYEKTISEILENHKLCDNVIDRYEREFVSNIFEPLVQFNCNRIDDLKKVLKKSESVAKCLAIESNKVNFGILEIDCRELKLYIKEMTEKRVKKLIENKVFEITGLAQYICNTFDYIKRKVNIESDSTNALIDQIKQYEEYKSQINLMKFDVDYIENHWNFIVEEGSALMSETDFEVLHRLYNWLNIIKFDFNQNEKRFEINKSEAKDILKARISSLDNKLLYLDNVLNAFEKKRIFSPFECISDNCQNLSAIQIQLNECIEESKHIDCEKRLLEWESESIPLLDQLIERKTRLDMIWKTADLFETKEKEWMNRSMSSLNLTDIRQSVEQLLNTSNNMIKCFKSKSNDLNQNANSLLSNIQSFKQNYIPLLEVLSNPVLQDRHWHKISEILGPEVSLKSCSTLTDIISLTNQTNINQIESLGNTAVKEHELEIFLEKMKNEWIEEWPTDALDIAANSYLEGESLRIEIKQKCVKAFKYIHLDSIELSKQINSRVSAPSELIVCITPPLFIELILTFKELLKEKQNEIIVRRNRHLKGLAKFNLVANNIQTMRNQLIDDFQPLLVIDSEETENLMQKIERQTIEIENKKEVIAADEAAANWAAASAQQIKDEYTKELSQAIPAIKSAINALNTLKGEDITFVRSMKKPPLGVRMVLEAICILKNCKPDKKLDPKTYTLTEDYWSASLRMLSDVKFLESLKRYDRNNIGRHSIALVRQKYLEYMEPTQLRKVSVACEGLAKWVRAIDIYDRVINVVKPKREQLIESETKLLSVMAELGHKKEELRKTCDLLQQFNDEFSAMSKKKKEIEENLELCRLKVNRAERLINGLEAEKMRWKERLQFLSDQEQNIIGDTLLSASAIIYTSALNRTERNLCLNKWQNYLINECHLPFTQPFSIINILGIDYLRTWFESGLARDEFNIENAIIVQNCKRFAIIVNPNQDINQWIQRLYPNSIVIDFKDLRQENENKSLFGAIRDGNVVLIENMDQIDSTHLISKLIEKELILQNGNQYLKIENQWIEYSPNFRLLMFTKHRLHLSNKTLSKIILINWSTTEMTVKGVGADIIALQKRTENEKRLIELEDRILEFLSTEETNVLEENAIKLFIEYQNMTKQM